MDVQLYFYTPLKVSINSVSIYFLTWANLILGTWWTRDFIQWSISLHKYERVKNGKNCTDFEKEIA
jgi:hypothetical protein